MHGSPAQAAERVCTDSRQLRPGDLFVALRGEHFDAHEFLPQALAVAAGVVGERAALEPCVARAGRCGLIAVQNTRVALGRLASVYRGAFSLPLIAVGGSNGKTTTKELIAAVLRQNRPTLWSESSFNNDVGVPLSLLRIDSSHRAAVLEVGTNHPGELEALLRWVRPSYGVVTSLGREHLEYFGDMAGVAQEEGWVAEVLPADGKLFLHADGEWASAVASRTAAGVVRVGFEPGNDWRVLSARVGPRGTTFKVQAPKPEWSGQYRVRLLGRHQAINATLAIALGWELGVTRAEVERGLKACQPAKMRMQMWEFNGVQVLDDAYNANVDSMAAALETLRALPCKGRRVAVLGDMAELGAHSEAAHEEVGRKAAEAGVGQLFAVGRMAPVFARGARHGGLNRVLEFAEVEPAAAAVRNFLKQGDLLLLKGSRAARLERVAELLRGEKVRVE